MLPAIPLNLISEAQAGKAAAANALWNAGSHAFLYGIKSISGLNVTLYGGNKYIAGEPTPIATQTLAIDDDDTVYVYTTSAGVFTKTTSLPSGWPGPLAAGATALYTFVTEDGAIDPDASENHVLGTGEPGEQGDPGDEGPAGTDLADTRKRISMAVGGGSTQLNGFGFDTPTTVGTVTARALASTSLRESIPYAAYESSASSGQSSQVYTARNFCYLGNAAGRGGFTLGMRIPMESAAAPANQRCFYGLFPASTGSLSNSEPDSFINIIGIGAKAGDANLSVIHNDGSGTATMVALGSNFPARATDNVYELLLSSVANSGVVSYAITDLVTGNSASGTLSSNLPGNTTFLTWVMWMNNGSTPAKVNLCFCQVVGETRY